MRQIRMWSAVAVLAWIHEVVPFPVHDESSFYVDDGWGNPFCHLATPRIIDYRDGVYYVSSTRMPAQNLDVMYRVGYVKTFAVFDYIGCTQLDNSNDINSRTDLYPDIGNCYSFCQTDYFGISDHTCYCFISKPQLGKESWCGVQCNDNAAWCGDDEDHISIFRIEPSVHALDDVVQAGGKNCRLYDGTAGRAVWENCSKQHRGLCSDLKDDYTINGTPVPWSTYTLTCFQDNQYPVTSLSREVSDDVWLGQIKAEIIKIVDEHQNKPINSIEGYVNQVYGDEIRLTFSNKKPGSGKRLCVTESAVRKSNTEVITTITSSTSATTTRITPTTTATATFTTLLSSRFTDTSGFTIPSTDNAADSRSKSASFIGSTYFYIAIGGSALILIGVVVICCCCCIRRKRRKGNVHIKSKHSTEKQDKTPPVGDVTYDVCDTPATSGSSGAPRDTDYDTAATLATHGSRSPTHGKDDSSNVYNTTQDFSNDIYDHAGASKDTPVVFRDNIYNTMATEDLYDHTSSDKSKPTFVGGNIYSTSRTVCVGKDNQVDDTYDNADGAATQTGGIYDNAGGAATQQGGGIVSKADGTNDTAQGNTDDRGCL